MLGSYVYTAKLNYYSESNGQDKKYRLFYSNMNFGSTRINRVSIRLGFCLAYIFKTLKLKSIFCETKKFL